jgi:hypothetical protein
MSKRSDDDDKTNKPWLVRDVPELTRRMVKGYAGMNHLTMAQAIQLLVSRGIAAGISVTHEPAYGVLRDMPEEAERLRSIGLGQVEPSGGDVDMKKMMAEFLRATEE